MTHCAHKYSMDIFYTCYIMNNHAGLSLRVRGFEFPLNDSHSKLERIKKARRKETRRKK